MVEFGVLSTGLSIGWLCVFSLGREEPFGERKSGVAGRLIGGG